MLASARGEMVRHKQRRPGAQCSEPRRVESLRAVAQFGGGNSQRPFVHGTPLQQSAPVLQSWPYWLQPPSGRGMPPSLHGPQVPLVLPFWMMQPVPGQQSAVTVHFAPQLWHFCGEQVSGETPLSGV